MSTKPPSNEQWIERLSIRNACRTHSAAFAGAAVLLLASCHQSEPPSEKAATPTPSAIETPAQPPRSQAASGSQSTSGSVTRTAPAGPRLVVLYSTCTLNKNYLSPYNCDVDFTPHLDAFADNSLVFERHQTGVAYASLFTGVQADKHGVYYHPTPLRDDLYPISEAFADAGYEVFFWSGHGMAASDLNYGQGVPSANVMETMLVGIDPKFQQILERLEREPDYKAFVIGLDEAGDRYFDDFFPDADPELMWVRIRDGDTVYKFRNLDGTEWGYEVFDLQSDPRETRNLYDTSIREHRGFTQRLSGYKTRLVDAHHAPSPLSKFREDVLRERIKSLGYVE